MALPRSNASFLIDKILQNDKILLTHNSLYSKISLLKSVFINRED